MQVSQQKRSPIKTLLVIITAALIALIGYYKFAHHSTAQTPAPTPHIDTGLQQIINNWAAEQDFGTAVAVQELQGDLRAGNRNATSAMDTASTYKIYVAYAVLHQVEQGKYTLTSKVSTGQTIATALSKMITKSDNDSGKALGALLGWKTIDSLVAATGATHTHLDNYNRWGTIVKEKDTTANDLALFLELLQNGKLLNESNTNLLLDLMKNQEWRERIPAGVPDGVVVADKPGWLPKAQNDAAIVYGPKSIYTLVVMTNGSTTQPLADLSEQIYTYLQR